jgi:hypothetical protein
MKSTKDRDPSSYIEVQDELKDFLSEREKKLIEEGLYPEEKPFYFRDIPEGEEGGDLVKNNNKNKSQFFAQYFKSMN